MHRYVLTILACASAACSGTEQTAPLPLQRAFDAAALSDVGNVTLGAMVLQGQDAWSDGGRRITTTGSTTTVSWAPCADPQQSGEGTLTTRNLRSVIRPLASYNPAQPSQVAIDTTMCSDTANTLGWAIPFHSTRGTVKWDRLARTVDVRLDVEEHDVVYGAARSALELHLVCDESFLCAPVGESTVSVDGLGTFTISGAWSLALPSVGSLVLDGPEHVEFDMSEAEPGPVHYRIDDDRGVAWLGTNQYSTLFTDWMFPP